MKLVVITNLFPNPQEPLRGIFVYNIVRVLNKTCELTVISPLPWVPKLLGKVAKFRKFSLIPEEFEIEGIKVFSPKYLALPKCGAFHTVLIFLALLPKLLQLSKKKKISLINTQCIFPDGVAVSWIARILKIPHVLTALGTDLNLYSTYRLRRFQIKGALQSADKTIVVSQAQKDLAIGLGIRVEKLEVIRNGVELQKFDLKDKTECRQMLGFNKSSKIILFVGRLIIIKGVDYLLEAFESLVRKAKNDCILVLVGAGELKTQCEKKAQGKNIKDKVFFVGEKIRQELPIWYGACDLLCLPSIMEGCPNVILEAIASGRPVVASRVGGIPEMVSPVNGVLFERGNVQELADKFEKVLDKDWDAAQIRNSLNGSSWENAAGKYLNVFRGVLSEPVKYNKSVNI
ncbi:MAG: glycosyltransferase family 4 protein [Candidatus Omnitrophota bacterium]